MLESMNQEENLFKVAIFLSKCTKSHLFHLPEE